MSASNTDANSLGAAAKISMDAPWRWLGAGWRDVTAAPLTSISYGACTVLGGALIIAALWRLGYSAMIPVAFGIFAMAGPILAVGLYEISRRLQEGEPVTLGSVIAVRTKSPIQIAYMGFLLMFAILVWVRIATLLYALFALTAPFTPNRCRSENWP